MRSPWLSLHPSLFFCLVSCFYSFLFILICQGNYRAVVLGFFPAGNAVQQFKLRDKSPNQWIIGICFFPCLFILLCWQQRVSSMGSLLRTNMLNCYLCLPACVLDGANNKIHLRRQAKLTNQTPDMLFIQS